MCLASDTLSEDCFSNVRGGVSVVEGVGEWGTGSR